MTRTSDSVAGDFFASYDADGSLTSEKLPGGYTLNVTEDPTGATTARAYTRDSDGTTVYTDTVTESVHGQVTSHQGWSAQKYAYDKAGRLTHADDTVGEVCTRRAYAFDQRSNRKTLTTATADSGSACTSTGATTTDYTYDSADRLVNTGYTYDAFGRTTALPGSTISYYTNDLVHQQTANGKRQTWQLDANLRFRSWTVETGSGTTWTQTASKTNHYDGDGDNPRWIVEDTTTGALTRNVDSAGGELAATTGKTGDTILQLTTIHGDVALQLPLDTSQAPIALDNDEYGNPRPGQEATRYNWLGAKQRSAETLTGLTLMGARLYNPATGRFLSLDPVYGGSANAYEYTYADPVNKFDLTGRWVPLVVWGARAAWSCYKHCRKVYRAAKTGYRAYKSYRKHKKYVKAVTQYRARGARWNNNRYFGERSRFFGDVHRGRQGYLNRRNWGIGWSAVGFKKTLGRKAARTVFRVKFGKKRHWDLRVGRWL